MLLGGWREPRDGHRNRVRRRRGPRPERRDRTSPASVEGSADVVWDDDAAGTRGVARRESDPRREWAAPSPTTKSRRDVVGPGHGWSGPATPSRHPERSAGSRAWSEWAHGRYRAVTSRWATPDGRPGETGATTWGERRQVWYAARRRSWWSSSRDRGAVRDRGAGGGGEQKHVTLHALAVIEGSGGKSSTGTTNAFTVSYGKAGGSDFRVGFSEDEVAGTGDQWTAAGWNAAAVATLLNGAPLSGVRVDYDVNGRIDGPSAGALDDRRSPLPHARRQDQARHHDDRHDQPRRHRRPGRRHPLQGGRRQAGQGQDDAHPARPAQQRGRQRRPRRRRGHRPAEGRQGQGGRRRLRGVQGVHRQDAARGRRPAATSA